MKIDNEFKIKISKSVVRIISDIIDINWNIPYLIEKPIRSQGTGFFINENYIITCAHVVNSASNLYIEFSQNENGYTICTCFYTGLDYNKLFVSPPN